MKLTKITVENFRCFEKLTLELHPELTVLIAPNGFGKTAMLDAARIAVWPFVKAFDFANQAGKSATIQIDDVRTTRKESNEMVAVIPSRVISTGTWSDELPNETWIQTRRKLKPRTNTLYDEMSRKLGRYAENLEKEYRDPDRSSPIDLPLIAYLGTGRLWYQGRHSSKVQLKRQDKSFYSRTWGYKDCITQLSKYNQFEDWFGWVFLSYREQQVKSIEKNTPLSRDGEGFHKIITVVQKAINEIIEEETGWKDIAYSESLGKQLILSHPDYGDLPLSMLSDGLRNSIVTAADIGFRCIKLNPHFGLEAAKKTTGIVMIDEVDMFLHPAWQQTIIPSFQRAFPKIQFIMTTHSPQALSTVKKESIRILKQTVDPETGKKIAVAKMPEIQSRGMESSDIIAGIMERNPTPDIDETRWLSEYKALIQSNAYDTERSLQLRARLESHFGKTHQAILECDRLIRLAKMKQKLPLKSKGSEK